MHTAVGLTVALAYLPLAGSESKVALPRLGYPQRNTDDAPYPRAPWSEPEPAR
jgi:hypothetical protein